MCHCFTHVIELKHIKVLFLIEYSFVILNKMLHTTSCKEYNHSTISIKLNCTVKRNRSVRNMVQVIIQKQQTNYIYAFSSNEAEKCVTEQTDRQTRWSQYMAEVNNNYSLHIYVWLKLFKKLNSTHIYMKKFKEIAYRSKRTTFSLPCLSEISWPEYETFVSVTSWQQDSIKTFRNFYFFFFFFFPVTSSYNNFIFLSLIWYSLFLLPCLNCLSPYPTLCLGLKGWLLFILASSSLS